MIQRGHTRAECFYGASDRLAFLHLLETLAQASECRVHAYVLMGNHVHLLLTAPGAGGVDGLMRALREGYLAYADQARGTCETADARAGPWLEEGFDASAIHAARHLLGCMRYIELNPVRARMVRRAQDYRWSSYAANAVGREDALVTPHPFYLALGRSPEMRQAAYRSSVEALVQARTLARKV